jgi:Pyruvate/2-oxoacid:ferredoxin oxidoreductase delta subunit
MAVAPIAIGYYLAGRFMLAKTFIATDKCNNCGLCIQQCPTKSIKLIDKRPFWKLTCESCMHCMNYCPERAIETSHITVIPLCWIIFGFVNPYVAMKITGYISEYAYGFRILNEAVVFTFQVIINIGLFAMVYYVFHRMMRYDFFIRLMRYTSLTGLRFWRRYRMPG